MTRDDIDTLWQQALHESVAAGEQFTRYHFAARVAAAEREACANICLAQLWVDHSGHPLKGGAEGDCNIELLCCIDKIRARSESTRRPPPISPEARAERAPPPPADLMAASPHRVKTEPGRGRAARSKRSKR